MNYRIIGIDEQAISDQIDGGLNYHETCGNCKFWEETEVPCRGICLVEGMKNQNTKLFESCPKFEPHQEKEEKQMSVKGERK